MVPLRHLVLFATALISIGSASIIVRLSGASSTACAFWRMILSALLLLAVGRAARPTEVRALRHHVPAAAAAGLSLAAHFILWMDSLFRTTVAVSVSVVVTYPLHLSLLESIIERKPLWRNVLGAAIGLCGVVTLLCGHALDGVDAIGVAESLAASFFAAAYLYVGRLARREADVYSYAGLTYLFGAGGAALYSVVIGDDPLVYLPRSWHWFLLLAFVPMIGGHTVMNYLLRFYRSSTVAAIALGEPVVASLLAGLALGESLTRLQAISMAAVLAGLALVLTGASSEGPIPQDKPSREGARGVAQPRSRA